MFQFDGFGTKSCQIMTSSVTISCNHDQNVTSNSNFVSLNHNHNNEAPITTLNCTDIGIDVSNYRLAIASCSSSNQSTALTSSSCLLQFKPKITVPFGWRREVIDGRVIYYSPSECALTNFDDISKYLLTDGTCKCGLECPVIIRKVFNFDPTIQSKPYDVDEARNNNETKLCSHKRKIIALATYKQSTELIVEAERCQNELKKQLINENENNPSIQQSKETDSKTEDINGCKTPIKTCTENVSVIRENQNDKFNRTCSREINQEFIISQNSIHSIDHRHLNQHQHVNCENGLGLPLHNVHQQVIKTEHLHNFNSNPLAVQQAQQTQSFCVYNDGHGNDVYTTFSSCNSIHQNHKPTCQPLYLQPTNNYGQMITYDSSNMNLIQHSPQTFSPNTYHSHVNHAYQQHDGACNNPSVIQQAITNLPLIADTNSQSYLPLPSNAVVSPNSANSGAITFHANPLTSNQIHINSAYSSQQLHSHDHSHVSNNIPILPRNSSMPPMSVPNVTSVTSSVTEVIPTVGINQQLITNSANPTGAPQVLQFINGVPLAPAVTVLQPASTQLLIPQLVQSDHQMMINSAMTQQAHMFPHIAPATNLTTFQNIGIATTQPLVIQSNCITRNNAKPSINQLRKFQFRKRCKKGTSSKRKSNPSTVASILKEASEKRQIILKLEKEAKLRQIEEEQQEEEENDNLADSSQTDSRSVSVAVQSESLSDNESPVSNNCSSTSSADTTTNDSNDESKQTYQINTSTSENGDFNIQIENNQDDNQSSDLSSEHLSPTSDCFNGQGSDSGVESEPSEAPLNNNCEEPDSQQEDIKQRLNMKRLKRLKRELSVYYNDDNSDDEPQSPPLPPQSRTFKIGDLVWGQIKGVSSWPGKLVSEDEIKNIPLRKEEGKVRLKGLK